MSNKALIIILAISLFFTGCTNSPITNIEDEPIATFEVFEAKQTSDNTPNEVTKEPKDSTINPVELDKISLDDGFAVIDFYLISGMYSRNVLDNDIEVIEMFAIEKNSFVRITTNDTEREVYAYNYNSTDFTYMYYFDGELLSKTVFNVDTGAVLRDDAQYAELLQTDADQLKTYFEELLKISGILLDDIITK